MSHSPTKVYLAIISFNSLLFSTTFGVAVPDVAKSINDDLGNKDQHFKGFSHNLLSYSDLDEFSIEKGAAISSPFGVGLMLANINEKVWNVSNGGIGHVLQTSEGKVADDYKALIDKMQKAQMSVSNTLFTRDQNISSKLSEGSRKLMTETKYVDFIGEDWINTWLTMNNKIANKTNGILNDQLIPKGGWWGGAFYYFTEGAFINTNHYKGSWGDVSWRDIGIKKFYDGFKVPYYETEGRFPFIDNDNFTAVAIKLKDGKKTVVFALPKIPFVPFLKIDMNKLVANGGPQSWGSVEAKKIQIPALNITLLDQHYKKLEAMGVNYTFCVDETDSPEVAMKKGPHFNGPIVQSHHVQFTPQYFEVASATGSSLNSEEKMREEGTYNPEAGQRQSGSGEAESDGVQISEGSEFVLPVEMDQRLLKALAKGDMELKKVDVIVAEEGKNDTLSASASSVEQISVPAPAFNYNLSDSYPSFDNSSFQGVAAINGSDSDFAMFPNVDQISLDVTTSPQPPTTPFVPEPLPENTLRFDRPFFWYLFDDEMGPLYYGTVHSLATYEKEYGIETDEDLWLYDAYKTLLWNCP